MKPKTLPQFTEELKRRFWSNVQIGDDAQCWEWNNFPLFVPILCFLCS